MAVEVPPIVRGEFVYRDALFVDVGGEGKRHTRASPSELIDLLNGKAPKDQVAHWYEAQLIHYGLNRSRDKNTAKVRLQQALNQGKLVVPPHLTDMEVAMKKDYASAVRKAKAQSKSSVSERDGAAKTSKKRKNEEVEAKGSKCTKISTSVDGISINIEHDVQQSAKEKQTVRKANAERAPKPAKPGDSTPKTKPTKQTKATAEGFKTPAPSGASKTASSAPFKQAKDDSKSKIMPQTSRTETKGQAEPRAKSEPKPKTEANVKAEPKPKSKTTTKPEPNVKKESNAAAPPKAKVKKETPIKADPTANGEETEYDDMRSVTGIYNIHSQQLEDQFGKDMNGLRLTLCVDQDTIWGGFELATQTGVLRIDDITSDLRMAFSWRARDLEDGSLRFDRRSCCGEMELFGFNQVRGTVFNMFPEPVHFAGGRRPGPLWCGRTANSFRQEWDGFVAEAYGR